MAVIKFPCAACRKLMAVGPELAGRKVRCPHCHEVMAAPTSAPAGGPTDSEDPFQFNKPPTEDDSIFGEPADEDLFGTPSKAVFDLPPPATAPQSSAPAENPFAAGAPSPFPPSSAPAADDHP